MKIALLSFEYPPETGFGGVGTYTWYHARGLAKLGHEVHVLAGATEATELRCAQHDGVTVHRLRSGGWRRKLVGQLQRIRLPWTRNRAETAIDMFRAFKKLDRRLGFDVVEMAECGAPGSLIATATHANSIIKLHSPAELIMPTYGCPKIDTTLASAIENVAIRRAGGVMSCSQFVAREAKEKMGIRRTIPVIANGIDCALFDTGDRIDARKKLDLPNDRLLVLFAARMEPRKGIDMAHKVASALLEKHRIAFVFAGADPFGTLQESILPALNRQRLEGSAHYVGRLDHIEMRSLMRQCDVFFFPSTWDNCPYSCLEAMAARRAIVSSDAGGLPEMIKHRETGLIAPVHSATDFVSSCEELIADANLRARLGDSARQAVEANYSDVGIAAATVDFYRDVFFPEPETRP